MLQDVTEAAVSTPKEATPGNPYRLPEGNVCVSFSGGRSSGYMLKQILLANPEAAEDPRFAVVFCNTGREMPETLDFVQECQTRFGIRIHWIEWVPPEEGYYRIVNHNSASRDGEPFKRMIEAHIKRRDGTIGRRPLPNPVSRICTTNLKLRLKLHYVRRELGWKTFTNAIGFRGDEMHRVARAPASAQPGETVWAPMADAGATKEDVIRFWGAQDFDLMLHNEKLGNCDLCFMKSAAKISSIINENPSLADWWVDVEERALASDRPSPFRQDRPTYKQMRDAALAGQGYNFGLFDDLTSCGSHGCTD